MQIPVGIADDDRFVRSLQRGERLRMHGPIDARLSETFAGGDYHKVAATGPADRWETHAALALCGNIPPAIEGLRGFDCPEARFYEGVAHWLAGDEDAAARLLENCEGEHARNLLALIRKPRIAILAQLPWLRGGPHTILDVGQNDPKFRIRNISFHPDDLQNRPYGDIHDYYDADAPPDFYISEMLEWHMVPPNIREFPGPLICHTGDYDMHVQMLYPWLRLFDEVLVTDTTEHTTTSGLVASPVTTVPKAFALPWSLPEPLNRERDLDLVVTGNLFHSYYPDKATVLHQILHTGELRPFFLNGFLNDAKYFEILARSKFSIAYNRHPGATPTRGLETLAMGCALLAQSETTLGLWLGEDGGLVTYDLENNGLSRAITKIMADPERYAVAAKRGMEIIRREFDPWQVGAYYLRMATFLAARPRRTNAAEREPLTHKRVVLQKGWLPHNHPKVHLSLRTANLRRWRAASLQDHTVSSLNDPARDILLEHAYQALAPHADMTGDKLLPLALDMYRAAIRLKPRSLALRFNFIRPALHFGAESDIEQALDLAKETLGVPAAGLTLDPLDDIMPWDYCEDFFNYRTYLDTATDTLANRRDGSKQLKDLIFASMHYYYGRMTGDAGHFARAAQLDPDFPAYRLWQAKELIAKGDRSAIEKAAVILRKLANETMFALEAWSLLTALKREHDLAIPEEEDLTAAMNRLDRNTVLDSNYRSLRDSPYYRSQRLQLGRNSGIQVRKRRSDNAGNEIQISIILADLNGSRYEKLLSTLDTQSLHRDTFELICVEAFDRPSPNMLTYADHVAVCGQSEYLYNRNVAFNQALIQAKGRIVVIFDRECKPAPDTLKQIVELLSHTGRKRLALINSGGIKLDPTNLHCLAVCYDELIRLGGMDESAYYAGAHGGPYELARRLKRQRFEIREIGYVPPAPADMNVDESNTLQVLKSEIWPEKFSPLRGTPIRSTLEIWRRRKKLV